MGSPVIGSKAATAATPPIRVTATHTHHTAADHCVGGFCSILGATSHHRSDAGCIVCITSSYDCIRIARCVGVATTNNAPVTETRINIETVDASGDVKGVHEDSDSVTHTCAPESIVSIAVDKAPHEELPEISLPSTIESTEDDEPKPDRVKEVKDAATNTSFDDEELRMLRLKCKEFEEQLVGCALFFLCLKQYQSLLL